MTDVVTRLTATLADRYRVERELGAGGMATVYLAHDLRHERDVAIKVLHPELGAALGGERFLAEIRTTARLQHPHILPLLDSGEASGLLYYVMPYVTGETLRARLDRERQLPIDDALRIAREVADALGEAHAHGIVHRDIKPENILLAGGHAMVADFGIALAVQHAGGHRITQTGLSLGTPQYMSPEQAMGERTIDARSDIYSLGAVTYEMLVGDPPFGGSTVQAIVARVLTEKPTAPTAVRDTVPPSVERAVLRSLAKLPADRFATAEKFAEALVVTDANLESIRSGRVTSAAPDTRPRRSRLVDVAALVVVASLVGVAAWMVGRRSAPPAASWSTFTQLTDASGVETSPSLSPDGQYFAYSGNARGNYDIYVQRVGGRTPVLVASDSLDEVWPAYSPDGKQIAYGVRGGGIFVVGATGESARRLTAFGSNPAWSPDGKRIVFGSEEVRTPYSVNASGTIWVVDVAGGEPRRIDETQVMGSYQPAWSPSGERIAFWSSGGGQRDIETMRADGSDRVTLTDDRDLDWAPAWSADGKSIVFASDRGGTMGLWRIALDESSGRPVGAPEPIAAGVDVAMEMPHPSADGNAVLFRAKLESANPASIAFDPVNLRIGEVRLLQNRAGTLVPTDVSPDGRWLALSNTFARQQDLFLMRADGSGLTRLTDDLARDWQPRFTTDGTRLTFYSNLSGKYDGWSIRTDGSARTRLTDIRSGAVFPMFAPDGKRLVTAVIPDRSAFGAAPFPVTDSTMTLIDGLTFAAGTLTPSYWSRSGRWISGYVIKPTGDAIGFGVLEVATGRARQLNEDSHSYDLAWLPDDRHVVYFTDQAKLVIQDVVTLARREIVGTLPHPPDPFGGVVASPDGHTLYYGARQLESNIWLVTRSARKPP